MIHRFTGVIMYNYNYNVIVLERLSQSLLRPTSNRAYIRYDHTIYCFQFVHVRLKSERDHIRDQKGAHFLIADVRTIYCSQNNRSYGRNRIDFKNFYFP